MATITKTSPFAKLANDELDLQTKSNPNLFQSLGFETMVANIGLYKHKDDLLVIHFAKPADVAGIFTLSKMASDPVLWCKNAISNSGFKARVLIVNSGCSNTYTGQQGLKIIEDATKQAAEYFNCKQEEVLVSSTGVIGKPFDSSLIPSAILKFNELKFLPSSKNDYLKIVKAIETTDTFSKIYSQKAKIAKVLNPKSELDYTDITITGIIKGSGMIEPNMATMLGYIFTDASIEGSILQDMLNEFKEDTFNAITVDSDSSTSDTVLAFASGQAVHLKASSANDALLDNFKQALKNVMLNLAKLVVMDGEGASKFITIEVQKSQSYKQAKLIGKAIANSPLVKTAIAGGDANWGRIAMAIGKTLEDVKREDVEIYMGGFLLAKNWSKQDYSEQLLTDYIVSSQFIEIKVILNSGQASAKVYTCDLTHEYISINGDYRS